jgi:hypothetical protein
MNALRGMIKKILIIIAAVLSNLLTRVVNINATECCTIKASLLSNLEKGCPGKQQNIPNKLFSLSI